VTGVTPAAPFDLLSTVEYGGCSAKLAPGSLAEVLKHLALSAHPDLLVGIATHDDAGVYRVDAETALIQTLDFFPPVCPIHASLVASPPPMPSATSMPWVGECSLR